MSDEARAQNPDPANDLTANANAAMNRERVSLAQVAEAQLGVSDLLPGFRMFEGERTPHSGLSPRDVPKAWLQGLRDAGVTANVAKHHLGGAKYRTMPLVIQIPCPRDHVDDSGETWAKVLLKINPTSGWVSIHEDSCNRCSRVEIERWLITCPRCLAGEKGHPDHVEDDSLFYLPDGDESPISYVIESMAQFLSGKELVKDMQTPPAKMTASEAVAWLDSLVTESGALLVPTTLGQSATWDAVKHLPGCPTQSLIREAQAVRKSRG